MNKIPFSLLLFVLSINLGLATELKFESAQMKLKLTVLASQLGVPWGMDFLSQNQLIFTEREGIIKILNLKDRSIQRVKSAPASHEVGQGGLLDLLVDPLYKTNRTIYLSYTHKTPEGNYTLQIAKARLDEKALALTNSQILFTANGASGRTRHFGSRFVMDANRNLYFTIGDRAHRPNSQDLGVDAGKIHRIKEDGSIPSDNPFAKIKGARPSLWSTGHRNPQGLAFHPDPANGQLFAQEHGPRGGDEINLIKKGANYGWPIVTHGKEYYGPFSIGEGTSKKGMEDPLKIYSPSIAPSGFAIYWGDKLPGFKGDFFSGALKLRHLNRLVVKKGKVQKEERLLEKFRERIREVVVGPDELLYISTDSGKIARIQPQ